MRKQIKKSSFKKSSGFTLIELLVAFSLIAIISGVGFASFVSYSRQQVAVQAAAQVKQTVDLAKFNALSYVKEPSCSQNEDLSSYKVNFCSNSSCLNSDGGDYELVVVCGTEKVVKTMTLPENIIFDSASTCSSISFNVLNGIAQGVPCDLTASGYGNQIVISIDQVGNVSY